MVTRIPGDLRRRAPQAAPEAPKTHLLLPWAQIQELRATMMHAMPGKSEFPENDLGFKFGSLIRAERDLPFLGLKAGDTFPAFWDGETVMSLGSLSWSFDQILDEIRQGVWTVVPDSEVAS